MPETQEILLALVESVGVLKGQTAEVIRRLDKAESGRSDLYNELNQTKLAVGGIMKDIAATKEDVAEVGRQVDNSKMTLANQISIVSEKTTSLQTRLSAMEIARQITGAKVEGAGLAVHAMRFVVVGIIGSIVWALVYILPLLNRPVSPPGH